MTFAMYLAKNGIEDIPKEWYHDPTITDIDGDTVAFYHV